MSNRSMQTGTNRLMLAAISVVLLTTGCWWQKDIYTIRMNRTLKNWQKQQEIANTLGERFDHAEDFMVSIMALKGLQVVEAPTNFVGLLRGGDPPVELVILGSNEAGSLAEFEPESISKLNAAQMGPGQAAQKQPEPIAVTTLYGTVVRYELFSGQAARNMAPAGAAANSVNYDWFLYFAEEGSQKVMLGFVIPDARYAELSPAVGLSLETLALASKFSEIGPAPVQAAGAAPAGGAAPGPAGGPPVPGAGKPAGF